MHFFQDLGLCVFLNFRYLSKWFAQIYRVQYGAAKLMELIAPPTFAIKGLII